MQETTIEAPLKRMTNLLVNLDTCSLEFLLTLKAFFEITRECNTEEADIVDKYFAQIENLFRAPAGTKH